MEVAERKVNDYAYGSHIRKVVVDAHRERDCKHEHDRRLALVYPVYAHDQQREQDEEVDELTLHQRYVYCEAARDIAESSEKRLEVVETDLPAEQNESEAGKVHPQDDSDRIAELDLARREE